MQRACSLFVLGCFFTSLGVARATDLQLSPDLDIQGQGVTIALDGVGLFFLGSGTETVTVTINGPVLKAFLYWAGREHPCVEVGAGCQINPPHQDQELIFDGNPLTGVLTGSEVNDRIVGRTNNIGYKSDVTALVQAKGVGTHNFTIADGNVGNDFTNQFSGAALVVVYQDPGDTNFYRVMGYEGLDFAFINGLPAAAMVTTPVVINHGSASMARSATVNVLVGDCEPTRPDIVRISNQADLTGTLDGSSGPEWDSDGYAITVPGGARSTSVEIISPFSATNEGDSLLWQFAIFRVSIPVCDQDCSVNDTACETFACDPNGAIGNCDIATPRNDCSINDTACATFACDLAGADGNCDTATPTVDCSTNDTACETFVCDPAGATGNCDVTMPTVDCSTNDTACETFACEPTGASGNCDVTTPTVDCSTNDTACETFACDPAGATGNCDVTTPSVDCSTNDTACETFACEPTGTTGNCDIATSTVDCAALSTVCETFACNPAGVFGNCSIATPNTGTACNDGDVCTSDDLCEPDGSCNGTPIAGCGGNTPVVPTVTQWGLLMMVLSGLILGTLTFGRRRSGVASK